MGTLPLPKNRGRALPQFLAHFYCGQTAGCSKMPLDMELGLSPGDFVLDGDPDPYTQPPTPKGEPHPIFGHVYCDQTAAWIKMPLGTDVGLDLYATLCSMWTQLHPEKRHTHPHPIFDPCLLWPNGWMDEDAAWYGSRPRPRSRFTRRGPNSRKRGTAAPLFSAVVYCGHGRPSQLLLSSC